MLRRMVWMFVLGVVLWVRKKEAGRVYWGLLTALQVVLGLQLIIGIVLFVAGGRQPTLHYFYGAVFPAIVLGVAHYFSRGLDKPPYHAFFTIGSFFVFGLTSRALMTGLGIG